MIRWAEPLWLFGLIIPLALLLFDLLGHKPRRKEREKFASLSLWPQIAVGRSNSLRRAKRILVWIALTMLVIGLANPQVGTRYEDVKREGIDLYILVDVSRSMDTQDIRPSRVAKTRYELKRFLDGLMGDRVGVIPFAGTAYTLCPLTLDYAAAGMFIDLLETDLIPTPGTALKEAITSALESFPDEEGRGQAIVLVSDGEDHEGGAIDAAKEAAKRGIPIFTIGMALEKGDPIPEYSKEGQPSGWKTDDEGHIVTSRLNEQMLREIASTSGGYYFRTTQGGDAFKSAYRKLFKLDRKEMSERQVTGYEDRFQLFLGLALLLLVIEMLIPLGTKTRLAKGITLTLMISLFILVPGKSAFAKSPHNLVKKGNKQVVEGQLDSAMVKYLEARAEMDTTLPEILYNLGGVYARKGNSGRADTLFRSLPPEASPELLARAAYNRGKTLADAEQYDQAVKSFIQSLQLDPHDMDSKINLEMALRKLQQQQQQQQQNQDQQDQDNQDKEQQQQQQQQQNQEQQQDQQNQQQQDQQEQQDEQQQQQQQSEQERMDKELAERFLDKLERDEKDLLKEVVRQQIPAKKKKVKKDW